MTYSQNDTLSSEILTNIPISDGTAAYLEARAKGAFYDYVVTKFKDAESRGLTKAQLARRLNKRPDHVSKFLASPGNWTIGSVALFLTGICNEELLPASASFIGRAPRNYQPIDLAFPAEKKLSGTSNPLQLINIPRWGN